MVLLANAIAAAGPIVVVAGAEPAQGSAAAEAADGTAAPHLIGCTTARIILTAMGTDASALEIQAGLASSDRGRSSDRLCYRSLWPGPSCRHRSSGHTRGANLIADRTSMSSGALGRRPSTDVALRPQRGVRRRVFRRVAEQSV